MAKKAYELLYSYPVISVVVSDWEAVAGCLGFAGVNGARAHTYTYTSMHTHTIMHTHLSPHHSTAQHTCHHTTAQHSVCTCYTSRAGLYCGVV